MIFFNLIALLFFTSSCEMKVGRKYAADCKAS